MAHIYRLIFVFIFSINTAFALQPIGTYSSSVSGSPASFADLSACQSWSANWVTNNHRNKPRAYISSWSFVNGAYRGYIKLRDPEGSDGYFICTPRSSMQCPENSILQNGECLCAIGYREHENQCQLITEEEKLAEYCGSRANKTQNITTTRPAGYTGGLSDIAFGCYQPPGLGCIGSNSACQSTMFDTNKGCMHTSSMDWGGQSSDGTWEYHGTATFTGGVCTPGPWESAGSDGPPVDEETPTPGSEDPKPCEGQPGTVNGVQVCLPYDSTKGADGTSKTNNPDGSSSETTSTTECKGSKCTTTTTTTNRDSNGNSTGTSTKTDTTTKDVYCQKNPAAGVCKGNGTTGGGSGKGDGQEGDDSEWGGSCDAGWTCEGDAIQCAIAKRQHEDSCEMKKETPESRLYGQSKDKTGKVTGDLEGNETHNFSGTLNTSARFSASSCIQDLTVVVANKTVTLPFSKICPHLANIGYVLLMVAGVIAVVIVMRRG